MNNDAEQKYVDELYDDFLALGEKYKDKLKIYEFGGYMIKFNAFMLLSTAPKLEYAQQVIEKSFQEALKWYIGSIEKEIEERKSNES